MSSPYTIFLLCPQERSVIVELARLTFGPLIKLGNVHQDLSVGSDFHVSPIHGSRRRAFEVNPFAVVSTAVARTLEFVLTRLPIGSATQMRTARVDHEYAIGSAIHPDAVFLLKLCIHSQTVFLGIANFETGRGLKQSTRQEEAKECEKPRHEKGRNRAPNQTAALLIDFIIFWAD